MDHETLIRLILFIVSLAQYCPQQEVSQKMPSYLCSPFHPLKAFKNLKSQTSHGIKPKEGVLSVSGDHLTSDIQTSVGC